MESLLEIIDKLGDELVSCTDGCDGIVQNQSAGILPRSLFIERPEAPGQGCFAVGMNPGRSNTKEREFYLKHGVSYENVKEYRKSLSNKPYFSRTRAFIDQLEFTGPIIWSNLAKCEKVKSRAGIPPLQTLRHCTQRFLMREINALPSNWVVIGIGRVAYHALAYLLPDRGIVGIPHPTGGYRDFRKIMKNGILREDLKDRALAALAMSDPGITWLGSGKSVT